VVEDDALVRNFVVAQLRSLGYKTMTAVNGNDALTQIEGGAIFDLLLTDAIMPGGINGRQLADIVVARDWVAAAGGADTPEKIGAGA
jgi:CheY-like chemotaxis protein